MKFVKPLFGCLIGAGLILHGKSGLKSTIEQHELNPLELKGSPYGEIIGLALQGPVHLLWHGGKGHEHVSKEGEDCEVCGTDHAEDGAANYLKDKPLDVQLKLKMLSMENAIRQNNNPAGRSANALAFENQRAKELIIMAYEMDPTNFGNYNIVSMLYKTSELEEERAMVDELALRTLAACEGRVNDPEDPLTAASVAHGVLVEKSKSLKHDEYYKLAGDYAFFVKKVLLFEESFQRALDDKRLENYTQEKVDDMISRYDEFKYPLREYKKKIEESKSRVVAPSVDFRFDKQPTR